MQFFITFLVNITFACPAKFFLRNHLCSFPSWFYLKVFLPRIFFYFSLYFLYLQPLHLFFPAKALLIYIFSLFVDPNFEIFYPEAPPPSSLSFESYRQSFRTHALLLQFLGNSPSHRG